MSNAVGAVGTAIPNLSAAVSVVTDEAKRQELRGKCRESLYFLCKAVLGFKDFNTRIHLPASLHIQDQGPKRKLLMLPRSFMKSHLATIGYPIWLLIQEPDLSKGFLGADERILIANATVTNSKHFLLKIKSVFEKNTVFQWLFPELIPDFTSKSLLWNQEESTIERKNTYPEPTFTAVGVGAAVVSRHFSRIILDDLINEDHTKSPDLMQKAIEWYALAESLLIQTKGYEQVVIGTRWSYNDLYSHIEKTEGEYDATTHPMGYSKHIRSAIEDGKAIFPERADFVELGRLKEKYGEYMFSCLYLNSPRGVGVNDFQGEWLRYYGFNDKGHIVRDDGKVFDPNELDRFAMCDIATSLRRGADFSAVVVFGVSEFRDIFILDTWHGRVNTKLMIDQFLRFANKWRVRCLYYEDSAQQKLVQYPLQERIRASGQYVRVEGVKPTKGKSKEDRIRMVSHYFTHRRVHFRTSFNDLIQEYLDFPLGTHDDLIDCVGYLPKIARFQYPEQDGDPSAEKTREQIEDEQEQIAFSDMSIVLSGRSIITGY